VTAIVRQPQAQGRVLHNNKLNLTPQSVTLCAGHKACQLGPQVNKTLDNKRTPTNRKCGIMVLNISIRGGDMSKSKVVVQVFLFSFLSISAITAEPDKSLHNSIQVDQKLSPSTGPFTFSLVPKGERQGGDTAETAYVIPSLPFVDQGETCSYLPDYNFQCPTQSAGPDVVYSITVGDEQALTIDLCLSGFDTVVGVFNEDFQVLECNDDFYIDHSCGNYVSKIEYLPVAPGETYFIVVDGWTNQSCGDYQISVSEFEPCVLDCVGCPENEPPLIDGYMDEYNSGCLDGNFLFQLLSGDSQGNLEFCGISGWYWATPQDPYRDTDWFIITIGESGLVEWTLNAEKRSLGYLLGPQECDEVGIVASIEILPCEPQTMSISGEPGSVAWIWVGPTGGDYYGDDYSYSCSFSGLAAGSVAVEKINWGGVKSFFR